MSGIPFLSESHPLSKTARVLARRTKPVNLSWRELFAEMHPEGIAHAGRDRGYLDFLRVAAKFLPIFTAEQFSELLATEEVVPALASNPNLSIAQRAQIKRWVLSANKTSSKQKRKSASESMEELLEQVAPGEFHQDEESLSWLLERLGEDHFSSSWFPSFRAFLRHPGVGERELLRLLVPISAPERLDFTSPFLDILRHPLLGIEGIRQIAQITSKGTTSFSMEVWRNIIQKEEARNDSEVKRLFVLYGSPENWGDYIALFPAEDQVPLWREFLRERSLAVVLHAARRNGTPLQLLAGDNELFWERLRDLQNSTMLRGIVLEGSGEFFRRSYQVLATAHPMVALGMLNDFIANADERLALIDLSALLASGDSKVRLDVIARLPELKEKITSAAEPLPQPNKNISTSAEVSRSR